MTSRIVGPVVVGVDGSTANLGALRYAAARARRLGTYLMLVHVVPDHVPVVPVQPIELDELGLLGASVLARAVEQVRAIDPDAEVESWLHHGTRGVELAAAAHHAESLVVGRDDRPLVERLLRGDTATSAAARSAVPVVEVPGDWSAPPADAAPEVLVGIKDPDRAEDLLADAVVEAARMGARVVALHAWHMPSGYDDLIATRVAVDQWRQEVRERLEPELDRLRTLHPEVATELRVEHSHAVPALVRASEDADLVVIARRARGFPATAQLGTTARAVLRTAACPVRLLTPDARVPG